MTTAATAIAYENMLRTACVRYTLATLGTGDAPPRPLAGPERGSENMLRTVRRQLFSNFVAMEAEKTDHRTSGCRLTFHLGGRLWQSMTNP